MCISLEAGFVRVLKTNIFKQTLKQRMMCKSFTNCGKNGQNKKQISYIYNTKSSNTGITSLLQLMRDKGLALKDLKTEESSLENIFVNLVKGANDELVRH